MMEGKLVANLNRRDELGEVKKVGKEERRREMAEV